MNRLLGFLLVLPLTAFVTMAGPALAQIAPGVQQSAQTATITGTVSLSDGTPVAGANVKLIGPAVLSTTTDVHGAFQFTQVPHGIYTIVAIAGNYGAASKSNLAINGDINVQIQYAQSSTQPKTIADVSTRAAGAHINVTPAAISSITPSNYAFQGNTSWNQLLAQLPGVAVSGAMNGGAATGVLVPGSPLQPVVISINGAQPYETLVSLDGMPLVNSTFNTVAGYGTDLSFLPLAMFDTADVVRGPGADAPSIMNSIGGSFVLHAPGQAQKNSFELSLSNDAYGGSVATTRADLRFGRLSAHFTYNFYNSPGPMGNTILAVANITPTPLAVDGQPFAGCGAAGCYTFNNKPGYNNCGCAPLAALLYGPIPASTSWSQHGGAIGLSYDVTPSITAQVFYAGSSTVVAVPGAKYPVVFVPGPGYTGSISPGLHVLEGGYPYYGNLSSTQAASLVEQKLTAYIGSGVLRFAAVQNNSYDSENGPTFYPPSGVYNLWGTGYFASAPTTPVFFNGTPQSVTFPSLTYNEVSWTNNRDVLGSYAVQAGPSSSLGVSYVASFYNSPSLYKEVLGFGGPPITFAGGQSTSDAENTGEFRLFATSQLSNTLALDASWYSIVANYHVQDPNNPTVSTFVDAASHYSAPRVGLVWRANPSIAVRASAGGGYALAPVSYLVGTNGVPQCTTNGCAVSLVNLNLKPETSFGFDLGADARVHGDTVFSADLYRTNLFGQVFSSTQLEGTYNGLPLYVGQYRNLGESRYEGLNLSAHRDVSRGVYWQAMLGLTRGYVVSVPPGFYNANHGQPCNMRTGAGCVNTYIVPGPNYSAGNYLLSPVPYANGMVMVGYRWSRGAYIDISPTYYGNDNAYLQRAFVEVDAHAAYPITKNISLLATLRNATNVYGESLEVFTPSYGAPSIVGPPFAQYGIPYGPRSVIVTLNFKW